MRIEGGWKDLETRGFVVLRGFLSEDDLRDQRARYAAAAKHSGVTAYEAPPAKREDISPVGDKISALLPQIRGASGLAVDHLMDGGIYFAAQKAQLGWHSDQLSFYTLQNHYDYLNFWIPLEKPDPERSGLCLIPLDRLRERAPEAYAATARKGAVSYKEGRLIYEEGPRDVTLRPPFDLAELAEIPRLSAGDALVVRGDVLHKTQDDATPRVALSMRACNAEMPFDLDAFLTMGARKHRRLRQERRASGEMIAISWILGRRRFSYRDAEAVRARFTRNEGRAVSWRFLGFLVAPILLARGLRRSRRTIGGSST